MSTTTAPARGRLGHRTLQVVQCVDVGRLQTHPVWVRSGALVAVTGLGPTDSNETSKTTWLAAVTLLTGDHGWDIASGTAGQHAARLLFDPPDGDGASRAEHGYVVGVFGPDATTLGVGEGGHLTVWLRINRSAPFLQFRLAPGVLVARGDTHAERIADADRLWRDMPGQSTLGPKQFLGEALGDIPRSTGYVSDRGGKPTRRASLLTSPLSDLTPEEIGDELVDLAGLRPRLRAERDGRRAAAEAAERLAGAQHRLTEERERVRAQLEQIAARVEALAAVDEASTLRDAYLAAQTLGLLDQRQQLAAKAERLRTSAATTRLAQELEEARTAVEELRDEGQLRERAEQAERAATDIKAEVTPRRDRHARLTARLEQLDDDLGADELRVADEHQGRPAATVSTDRTDADAHLAEARVEHRGATAEAEEAEVALRRVEARDASPEVAALHARGVAAQVLGNVVEPTDAGRGWWDAALAPWREALVVPDEDLEQAVDALADRPGTVLVHGDTDGGALPAGIADAPAAVRRWLRRLADGDGERADATAARVLGDVAVVGGYSSPQTGHAARLRAAEAALETARTEETGWEREVWRRSAAREALVEELAAAEAHERREDLRERRRSTLEERQDLAAELEPLEERLAAAESERDALVGRLTLLQERRQAANDRLKGLQDQWEAHVERPLGDLADEAVDQRLSWWVGRMQATDESLASDPPGDAVLAALDLDAEVADTLRAAAERTLERHDAVGRRVETLRRRYQENLGQALERLGVRTSTAPDGTVTVHAATDVPDVIRRRVRERAESLERANAARVEAFDALVADLRDVYGPMAEQDELRRDQIQRRLAGRERDVDAAAEEHASQLANAQHLQSSLEDMVRTRLDALGRAFAAQVAADDGAAAELRVTPVIPGEGEHDRTLRFEVIPRWSRKPGGSLVDYRKPANLAQLKLKAVQLLLAALRADDDPAGRVLVLDELGANLGDRHREWVLRGLATVARRDGVTVLATVQDDLQSDAFRHVDEVLVFRYRGGTTELNDPTSMLAAGPDGRLRPVAELLEDGWPDELLPALDDAAAYRPERGVEQATVWEVPDHVPDDLLGRQGPEPGATDENDDHPEEGS